MPLDERTSNQLLVCRPLCLLCFLLFKPLRSGLGQPTRLEEPIRLGLALKPCQSLFVNSLDVINIKGEVAKGGFLPVKSCRCFEANNTNRKETSENKEIDGRNRSA